MTRMVLALLFALPAGVYLPETLCADVLLIEEVRQSDRMELPENGISKTEVRARYGEPTATHSAVGDPPISRWDYDGWSAYFEYDLVLFTVLHKGHVLDKNKERDS